MRQNKNRLKDSKIFSTEVFNKTAFDGAITAITAIEPFVPTATKAFIISFECELSTEERTQFEALVFEWFRVGENFQHQAIPCWREKALILLVF